MRSKKLIFAVSGLALCGAVACSVTGTSTSEHSGSVDGRMHVKNTRLGLTGTASGSGLRPQTFAADGAFTYVASVDSPVDAATGKRIQATNFAFDDRYAYIVYNVQYEEVSGGLDVVDLQDLENPRLVSSTLFDTAEFADIKLSGHYAYLAGHRSDGYNAASVITVDVADVEHPQRVATLDLTGHYATSIAVDGKTAYVTTGDDGGLAQIDVTNPALPSLTTFTAIPHALHVVRDSAHTYLLGGSPSTLYTALDGNPLAAYPSPVAQSTLESPARVSLWNRRLYTNAGANLVSSEVPDIHPVEPLASLLGTSNGLDVADGYAVLAQGEKGTAVFDVATPGVATSLGSFAFPDERGSANEVRYGATSNAHYIFLSNGLEGFRIIRFAGATTSPPIDSDAGTAGDGGTSPDASPPATQCVTPDWSAEASGNAWWSAPAPPSDATAEATEATPGAWSQLAVETTPLCIVEVYTPFEPTCVGAQLKRARAIGDRPNEGQSCPLTCPTGTVISNAHTRYGEASPFNEVGGYSCSGATERDTHEIDCDSMSDFCNTKGQSLCLTTYHNSYCGDPWVNCIKTGRTRWECVPSGVITPPSE